MGRQLRMCVEKTGGLVPPFGPVVAVVEAGQAKQFVGPSIVVDQWAPAG